MENDPVNKIDMHEATMNKIQEIKAALGDVGFDQLMQSVDPAVKRQLEEFPLKRQQRLNEALSAVTGKTDKNKKQQRRRRRRR